MPNNTGYGRDSGPSSSDPGTFFRQRTQIVRMITNVRTDIDAESTFIAQMDKADQAKAFVTLIGKVRMLHDQLEKALTVARSSGAYRRRPGFSAAIDVWVRAGVKLTVAINSLSIAGSIAGSPKYTRERKMEVQLRHLENAANQLESIEGQLQMQMNKEPTRPATTNRGHFEY